MTTINIDDVQIGNDEKIVFFAGLNVLESSEQAIEVALKLKQISDRTGNHFGIHTITFFNEDESIKFMHEALSREIFSQTALDVSKKLINKDSGLYILEDFIFLK